MKNLIFLLTISGLIIFGSGCNLEHLEDDIIISNPVELPESVTVFITENFPGFEIRSAEEEDICDDIPVLEVELEDGPGPDVDLYFTPAGEFLFTATDITIADLPEVIRTTITTDFSDYFINVDDVERFDYPDGTVEYEVELVHSVSGEEEDAVFASDGTLVCFEGSSSGNGNGNGTPVDIPQNVSDFIGSNYPGYEIRGAETEDICDDSLVYEVELEDGPGPDVDLYFTIDWIFLLTATDISPTQLPEEVRVTITNDFSDYTINADDVEQFDYPDGTVEYEVELVHNTSGDEDDALFAADGTLICFEGGSNGDPNNGSNGNLPSEVQDFISGNYPGYVITSVEQEDICDDILMYEVELEDGPGRDVELYFNLDWEFQFSQTEISADELPESVRNVIATNYADYVVDEDKIERQEWADGAERYAVELESNEDDLEIIFNLDGSLYCLDD